MKFLKTATLMGALSLVGLTGLAEEEVFDFERLKTTHGRTYDKIFVISADAHGLMFRHEAGIAKLSFQELPMNLRMLYEPAQPEPVIEQEVGSKDQSANEDRSLSPAPVYVTYLVRPVYQITRQAPNYCRSYAQHWPQHWPRYHPAHSYAHVPCREMVVRDFLYTTGLACKPPGVVTRRLPYRRPYVIR